LLEGASEKKIEGSRSDYMQVCDVPYPEEINQACAVFFNITRDELCSGGRGVKNEFRKMGMYACRMWGSMKLIDIAREYNCHSHGNVSNAVSDVKKRLLTDRVLVLLLEELKNKIFHK